MSDATMIAQINTLPNEMKQEVAKFVAYLINKKEFAAPKPDVSIEDAEKPYRQAGTVLGK